MTIKELIEHLKGFNPDSHVAYLLWLPEDVICAAEELYIEISEKEAETIIDQIEHYKDCEYGISWNDIQNAIYELKGE